MEEKNRLSRFIKGFGFVYFLLNCVIVVVLCIMAVYTMLKGTKPPGWILLVFPGIGILAGRWIRYGKYNWWRYIIIGLSFLTTIFTILSIIFILPQIEGINQMHQEHAKELKQLDTRIEEYFTAIYVGDVATVKKALDEGIYIEERNGSGLTALHVTQSKEIVEFLTVKGADVNALDEYGMTPIFNKEMHLTKILVEAGADFNVKSKKGNTPLMWYCYSGYLGGIKYMVSLGADVNVKNVDGQTAYDIAEHFHPQELLGYLRSVGALSGKDIK